MLFRKLFVLCLRLWHFSSQVSCKLNEKIDKDGILKSYFYIVNHLPSFWTIFFGTFGISLNVLSMGSKSDLKEHSRYWAATKKYPPPHSLKGLKELEGSTNHLSIWRFCCSILSTWVALARASRNTLDLPSSGPNNPRFANYTPHVCFLLFLYWHMFGMISLRISSPNFLTRRGRHRSWQWWIGYRSLPISLLPCIF